jgi:hypothetical protein
LKYQKKPVVIEAALWNGRHLGDVDDNGRVIPRTRPPWFPAITRDVTGQGLAFLTNAKPGEVYSEADRLLIVTPEGVMTASPGDWIIRGVVGELYPCKPDIFVQTYEATGEPDDAPAPLKAARG